MFLNRIDNLHILDDSIIFLYFFSRIYALEMSGNALITQVSDIIARLKSQTSDQKSIQNRNVGYTYLYSIIFLYFFSIIYALEMPGNALITQVSDIIERIKSQPSDQKSIQNRNVGYTYLSLLGPPLN